MVGINIGRISSRKEVVSFLDEIKNFLQGEDFNIDTDFVLIPKSKDDIKHSNIYTLQKLGYGTEEIIETLKNLTVKNYSETKIDKDNLSEPDLFVFGKKINKELVYIKFKLKKEGRKHILCVSFHFAKEKMNFPYA